ncbi:hypothetical protein SEUCBS140593_006775 [Sporothrix eucalyptigena]|uniref:Major facilitator superfamily (MFS) profile domain-containing protein n=1 Tax=Sporothrix eucalyptigena TaxID=1812306 RepID=A0ABP0C7N1_9PEZI
MASDSKAETTMSLNERNAGGKPASPDFSHQKTTPYMIVFSFWVGLFGWLANFDAAFGGIVLIMEPYKKSFGHCVTTTSADGVATETCSVSSLQQSLIQITSLFMALGGGLSALVGDYLGRRGTLQLACLLVAVGAGGMMSSVGSFLHYMVCKCIGGVGIGMVYSAAPTWGTEFVSPAKRGLRCKTPFSAISEALD